MYCINLLNNTQSYILGDAFGVLEFQMVTDSVFCKKKNNDITEKNIQSFCFEAKHKWERFQLSGHIVSAFVTHIGGVVRWQFIAT